LGQAAACARTRISVARITRAENEIHFDGETLTFVHRYDICLLSLAQQQQQRMSAPAPPSTPLQTASRTDWNALIKQIQDGQTPPPPPEIIQL
jgi:hypothetical protein